MADEIVALHTEVEFVHGGKVVILIPVQSIVDLMEYHGILISDPETPITSSAVLAQLYPAEHRSLLCQTISAFIAQMLFTAAHQYPTDQVDHYILRSEFDEIVAATEGNPE